MFIVLERLLQFYPTLKKMVVCNVWFMATFWDFWGKKVQKPNVGQFLWNNVKNIVKDLQPFYIVFHLADKEGSTMGLFYEFMLKVGNMLLISNMLSIDQFFQISQRWISRWEWFHQPIHVVAHILHPLWYHPLGNIFHELQDGWTSYLNIHCCDPLDENALDDEFLKFLRKEGLLHKKLVICKTPCWPLYLGGKNLEDIFQNFKLWH